VSDPNALGNSLEGDVDELAIWNKALTAAQIQSLYTIGRRQRSGRAPARR
jgi:hypothetical protein